LKHFGINDYDTRRAAACGGLCEVAHNCSRWWNSTVNDTSHAAAARSAVYECGWNERKRLHEQINSLQAYS